MAPTTVAALVLSLLAGLANSQGAELFECPRGKTKKNYFYKNKEKNNKLTARFLVKWHHLPTVNLIPGQKIG